MSEFTSGLFVPQPPDQVAELVKALKVPGVIIPANQGSVVLLPWENWDDLTALVPVAWSYAYTEDYGHLVVTGFRKGQPWLELDFNDPDRSDDFDDFLDEDGLYPDGTPGPAVARTRTWQNVQEAHARGDLDDELCRLLLSAAQGDLSTEELIEDLPSRLGFGVLRWLQPEDINHRSREEWREEYPGALVIGL